MKKIKVFDEKYYNSTEYRKDIAKQCKRALKEGTYAKNDFNELFIVESDRTDGDKDDIAANN